MDTTYESLISYVKSSPNKKHFRVRKAVERVNTHIGGLRVTARKMKGTTVASFCNREANFLEKKLNEALGEKTYE